MLCADCGKKIETEMMVIGKKALSKILCANCFDIHIKVRDEWVVAERVPDKNYLVVNTDCMPAIHVLQELAFKSLGIAMGRNLSDPFAGDRLGFKNLLDNLRRSLLGDPRVESLNFRYEHEALETGIRPVGTRVVWRVQPTRVAMMVQLEMDVTEDLNQCAKVLVIQIFDERQTFDRPFDLFATMFTNSDKVVRSHADTVMRITRKKT